jgi:hypothetical protein
MKHFMLVLLMLTATANEIMAAGTTIGRCSSTVALVECISAQNQACGSFLGITGIQVLTFDMQQNGWNGSMVTCGGTCPNSSASYTYQCTNPGGGGGSNDTNGDGTVGPCEGLIPACDFCHNCNVCPQGVGCP